VENRLGGLHASFHNEKCESCSVLFCGARVGLALPLSDGGNLHRGDGKPPPYKPGWATARLRANMRKIQNTASAFASFLVLSFR